MASQSQTNVVQLFFPLSFASVVLLKNQLFFIQHITNNILLSVPQPFMLKLFHFFLFEVGTKKINNWNCGRHWVLACRWTTSLVFQTSGSELIS